MGKIVYMRIQYDIRIMRWVTSVSLQADPLKVKASFVLLRSSVIDHHSTTFFDHLMHYSVVVHFAAKGLG
jgi:hypothetical protein